MWPVSVVGNRAAVPNMHSVISLGVAASLGAFGVTVGTLLAPHAMVTPH